MKTASLQTEDPIIHRLNSVAGSSPDLRAATRLYETILPLVRDADIHVLPLCLTAQKISECLEKGVPVLSAIDLEVEFQKLEGLMVRLVCAVESMSDSEPKPHRWKIWQRAALVSDAGGQSDYRSLNIAAAQIRSAYEAGCLDMGEILGFAACGNYDGLSEKATALQLDTNLLCTLAQNSLKSALHSCSREILPLTAGLRWDKGYCFVCGSTATLGELQDNDQIKHLRCGQCGADWHFNRLQCLYCGNMDHATQQILSMEGCDSQRIEACDMCGGYLKVIASFAPTPPDMLAVEDLATLHLDFIAQQRGYTKARVSPGGYHSGKTVPITS